ncbi:MAG TPA: hypothetical protein VIO80_15735 [Candidatus Dormibacteraeota bacterium]
MTPEERELRRALDARSGNPSPDFQARLAAALAEAKPHSNLMPALALVAAVTLTFATVGVLLLARHGAQVGQGLGPASGARVQTPTPATALALNSVAMYGDNGWATTLDSAGPITSVLRTGDGGYTWRTVTLPTKRGSFIFGFAPIDASRAWLMVAGPTETGPVDLWATQDGGQTWSKTTAPAFVFRGALITFTDGTHGWFAVPGQPGSQSQEQGIVIDRTTDGGKTWRVVAQRNFPPNGSTPGAPSATCGKQDLSFLDSRTGWLTGGCTGGITFDMTTDGGVTWKAQRLNPPPGGNFATVCGGGPCTLTAPRFVSPPVGADTALFASLGYMVLHDTGVYPGRSWLYASHDHGQSWTIHRLPGQETSLSMLTDTVGFASSIAVDSAGAVDSAAPWFYRTDDAGQSWKPVVTNVQVPYASLDCVSALRCWALSASQTDISTRLYETTNGGQTWSQLAGPLTPPAPQPTPAPQPVPGVLIAPPVPIALPANAQLSAPSSNVVWALMVDQFLYRSTNGGAAWQQRPLPPSQAFCPKPPSPCPFSGQPEISFVSDQEGWLSITGASTTQMVGLWHTSDGGATWQSLPAKGIGDSKGSNGLSFIDSNRGFIDAWNPNHASVIYRTTDGGQMWTASQPLIPPFKTACIDCIAMEAGTVRAFGSTLLVPTWQQSGPATQYVFRSTDGGVTWAYIATAPGQDGNVVFVTASRWLKLIGPGQSLETTDAGANWHRYASDYSQAAPIAADFVFADSKVGYGTVRGGITNTVDGGLNWGQLTTPGT